MCRSPVYFEALTAWSRYTAMFESRGARRGCNDGIEPEIVRCLADQRKISMLAGHEFRLADAQRCEGFRLGQVRHALEIDLDVCYHEPPCWGEPQVPTLEDI